jgi:hypothetical protein
MQSGPKSCREEYTTGFVKSATFLKPVHQKDGNKKITLCNKEYQLTMEMIIDFPGGS